MVKKGEKHNRTARASKRRSNPPRAALQLSKNQPQQPATAQAIALNKQARGARKEANPDEIVDPDPSQRGEKHDRTARAPKRRSNPPRAAARLSKNCPQKSATPEDTPSAQATTPNERGRGLREQSTLSPPRREDETHDEIQNATSNTCDEIIRELQHLGHWIEIYMQKLDSEARLFEGEYPPTGAKAAEIKDRIRPLIKELERMRDQYTVLEETIANVRERWASSA